MSVLIPDDILRATKMTEDELKLEIAIMLYKQEKISSGKARAWTGLTVVEFQHDIRSLVTSSRDSRGGKAVETALAVSKIFTNDVGLQYILLS